jgi:hypothetical protein
MNNPNIRQYLVTAATVFSLAMPLSALTQSLQNHFSGETQNPSKTLSEGVFAGLFIAAFCTGFIIYNDEQRKKQAEKCLPYYFRLLAEGETYPKKFSELIASFLNPYRFDFIESPNPRLGSYNPSTSLIMLPKSGGPLEILVHELTHALKQDPNIQPKGASYLEFMRDWLCEEIVAESSRYYGSKQILKDFSSGAIFLEYDLISKGIKQDDKETLIESAAYAVLSKNCFEKAGWITDYTTYYNRENNTNHSANQTFEPPLLPPTLARAVKDILENNPSIKDMWHQETGITPETLALAAEQTQWPMFKSDILKQKNMELLVESRHAGR